MNEEETMEQINELLGEIIERLKEIEKNLCDHRNETEM